MTETGKKRQVTGSTRDLCWSCGSELHGEYFCPRCVKAQPVSVWSDYFTLFGLPRKLMLDLEELERAFYAWSRKFHPDYFQRATRPEQTISLENSALVNAAYRTLRDPVSRVEYLIRLEEGAAKRIQPRAPRELLEEMLEIREVVEGARASGLDAEARARLVDERGRLKARRDEEEDRLLETGREWDALLDQGGPLPPDGRARRQELLSRMKEILAARAYLTTVIDDLSDVLGADPDVPHRRH